MEGGMGNKFLLTAYNVSLYNRIKSRYAQKHWGYFIQALSGLVLAVQIVWR